MLDPAREWVGVLLPNVNGTVISVLGLWRIGKIPAVLNYSNGVPLMLLARSWPG